MPRPAGKRCVLDPIQFLTPGLPYVHHRERVLFVTLDNDHKYFRVGGDLEEQEMITSSPVQEIRFVAGALRFVAVCVHAAWTIRPV